MKMVPAPPPMTSSPIMSSSSHQQFQVTEDTPVDFLEGCMEILVVFPNEKSILMSIQRRMPMLDLLIHVTAANKISPAAHLLQVTDEDGRLLPHKPSTPIGSLNAHKVYIVAKNRLMADRSNSRSSNAKSSASQFEQSFRVQVRLPRNQLFVTRVTGRTQLADLLHTVCNEKALDPRHYELRHPVNLDERLRLNSCLDDYKLQEVVLVPLGGKNSTTLLTPAVSVSDLSSSSSNSMNRKSASVTVSNSSKMSSSKSTLKSTTSEATLVGHHEKKKRGLLGLLGFGKHKKGSSMGDSSISSDSAGDRSISPSRSEEPAPPPPPVETPVAPTPPSPVLFSKRLAEEAVAKRNSRLMLSQMSTEASTPPSNEAATPLRKTISTTSTNGVAATSTKPGAKKKRAPAPPQLATQNGINGPPKAASEVSSYSTSSSGSNYVSPSTSVIHHSEEEVVLRSPSPKLSYQRQESNNVARQRQSSDSGCSSPLRSPRSNLITTPGNSSSNLTQVSSTSNASLASAIKKRKAPVPPPALQEQVETSEKIPPAAAAPVVVVVVNGGSHDDSDRASCVSDQLSSVSDMSSTHRKSSATPEIIEPPIVVELTPQPNHQQQSSDLDSPRSSAEDSSNAASERPANSVSSEDDYELLNYRREKSEDKNESFREAHQKEEVVVSEPIYTMVIKSPRPLVAVNVEPEKDDKCQQTNGDIQVDEPDRMVEVKANPIPAEEEPVMERDAGDGQTESPIMWEYKLPAPPTPFQDSIQSPLDKLQIASETESRRSSMSTDSLQNNRSAEEEDFVKDSPRSSIDSHEEEPLSPQILPKISIKEDCDTNEDAVKLHLGVELLGESATEESVLICPAIEEVKVVEEKVVVLQSSDPEAKPYGIESTTDEPLSLEPSSLPPVPSTLPPYDSDDDSLTTPDMRFSIATYTVRVNKDSTYEKKLARSSSPDQLTREMIKPDSVKEVNDPLALVAETKEPETVADPVKIEENSGSSGTVPAAAHLPLPMLNADFIQQFQNALHSITDPKARALQEEFLRLQQQFLTLQMQAAVQQNVSPVPTESTSVVAHHSETIKLEDKTIVADVPQIFDSPIEVSVETVSKRISLVESPVEIPLKTIDPIQDQYQKEEVEVETPVYRYAGPPQVKLDTWKPGRPRSEVIDFSRSSSFNVPLAPVNKKIDSPEAVTPVPAVVAMESPASPTVTTIPEEEAVVPVQLCGIAEEESKIKSVVIASEVEETFDVREKIEQIESSSNNSSSSTSPVPKPVVLRKSSFITARPFEARPVSMPIKRPNFTPMVIQPVPFVFGKIRAPEVRGFASLPPDNRTEMQGIRTSGSAGITPFSAVNKPRSFATTVSKENPTIVIRNKLIESARRPSAELNGIPIKLEDSSDQVDSTAAVKEVKESSSIVSETRRVSSSSRPLSMPMSSSLLLAAGAGGAVNKPQPVVAEISNQPISSTAQQSVVPGADPTSTAGRRSLSSKFVRKVDPREELLNSIRTFANGGSLKKTGTSLEK